ncbi:hypothetical protein JXM83_04685 [Candidatus Woesearchaeota archaeon]|nr:hypothetical protein [Candidatus Woesearchaeota archaeon]
MNRTITLLMMFLIMSIPICYATELHLIYDANGNLVSGDGYYREYNSLNQLSSIRNESVNGTLLQTYVYDPVEERIIIKTDYVKNETTYYFSQEKVRVVNRTGTYNFLYVYHEGQLVAQVLPNGTKQYIADDQKGSASVLLSQSGAILEKTFYSPAGEILSGGNKTKFSYEGKEYDKTSKTYDFDFRMYNANNGIMSTPDNIIQNVYDPQSLNHYMFERGNSYKYQDDDGHWLHIAAAAAVGGLVGLGTYFLTHNPNDYTMRGALSYTIGGAAGSAIAVALAPVIAATAISSGLVSGGSAALTVTSAAISSGTGSIASQIANNYGDDTSLTNGLGVSFVSGTITGGLAPKILPISRYWLIKNPVSYLTTKTGQTYLSNQFIENTANSVLNGILNDVTSKSTSNRRSNSVNSRISTTNQYSYTDTSLYPNDSNGQCVSRKSSSTFSFFS